MDEHSLVNFLDEHRLAVISTFGAEYPESAVIEFGNKGLELIFDTFKDSRKYINILDNSKVSFVIGWDDNKTLQFEGIAELLDKDELEEYRETYFQKIPEARKWALKENIAFFKVLPKWIRYTDLNTYPWTIYERNT